MTSRYIFAMIICILSIATQPLQGQANIDQLPVSKYGKVVQIKNFESANVIPRNVEIYVPNDYDANAEEKYNVLYMHDGQNVFNDSTSYTKVSWGIDHIVDSLVSAGTIHKTIIVAPWNTYEKRFSEFMPEEPKELTNTPFVKEQLKQNTGFDDLYSDEYLAFIVKELKPYIDKHYHVHSDAAHTSIMGSSMGGLISLYAISKYPEVFGAAGSVSTHWPVLRLRHHWTRFGL